MVCSVSAAHFIQQGQISPIIFIFPLTFDSVDFDLVFGRLQLFDVSARLLLHFKDMIPLQLGQIGLVAPVFHLLLQGYFIFDLAQLGHVLHLTLELFPVLFALESSQITLGIADALDVWRLQAHILETPAHTRPVNQAAPCPARHPCSVIR